jgi:metal-dependent amidase/aminoacylase/carboxypeptidase family protein
MPSERAATLARAAAQRLPAELGERLVRLRRDLHRRPELSNEEMETTARLRRELDAWGVDGIRPLGPTGLVESAIAAATSVVQRVPSAIAWIDVRDEAQGIVHPLHHPRFAVDESVIPMGVELLLDTAVALLEDPPPPLDGR